MLFRIVIALFCLTVATGVPGAADDAGAADDDVEKLLVVTEEFPPYNYTENGEIKGTSTSLVRAILAEAGLEYDLDVMPWKRAMHTAENRPDTLIYSITRLPAREPRFLWLAPLYDNPSHLYCAKKRTDLLDMPMEQIRERAVVCVQDGTSGVELLLAQGFRERNLLRITDQHNHMCMRLVSQGQADFFARSARKHEMEAEQDRPFARYPALALHETLYLAAHLETAPEIIERIRKAVASLRERGVLILDDFQ